MRQSASVLNPEQTLIIISIVNVPVLGLNVGDDVDNDDSLFFSSYLSFASFSMCSAVAIGACQMLAPEDLWEACQLLASVDH